MNPGIFTISAEQYHAASGVSKSMLDWIAAPECTPAHYRARFITKEIPDSQTDAMRLGSIMHRVCLEPDSLDGAFWEKPDGMSFATKEGKAWRAEHSDRPVIAADDVKAVKGMRDAVWRHPVARKLLAGAETERSLFATDKEGTLRKGRLDALIAGNVVPDLKTCLSTEHSKLERVILDLRYHVQIAYYADLCGLLGIPKEAGVLIFVEKTPPYDVVCAKLDDQVFEMGRREYKANLATLRHCLETDTWPGRSDTLEEISLPAWHMKQMEQI